ncbi:MAG TPA: type II toxin-antitoxin system death-on-curing family toxin [Solirubrobacteraceae bacterium]|nr:type II toxin-antitoxin system death-on-curing family toxin [Solirubrobacteraceae bacterium]
MDDFLATAAEVLGASEEQLGRLPGLALAESALAAPFAGFGDEEAYPTLALKAAVLLERLVRNHPLPDGNKRTALAMTIDFLDLNGCAWGDPDVAGDVEAVLRVAAGEAELEEIVSWIRRRTATA